MTTNVLNIIDTGGPGGAETVYLHLATALDPRRYRSICVVSRDGWLTGQLRSGGIAPIVLPSQGSLNVRYLAALCRIIRRERVGVVVAHLYGSSVYAGLAGLLCRVPVVAILHGQTDIAGEGRFDAIKRLIVARGTSRLVFVSERLRDALAPVLKVPARRCVVVPNGVDAARFQPGRDEEARRELGVAPGDFLLGAIGNIRAPKAYDVLLRAVHLLKEGGPPCKVVIAGEGSGSLMQELETLRRQLGVEDSVRFLGLRNDVQRLLRGFDAYVLSSRTEGFSIACVEAMASGLPVIATRSGGPEEIIEDGISGLLVPTDDPEALAGAISRVIRDPGLARDLGSRARHRACDRYSIGAMVQRYESLLEEVVSEHQA